MTHLDIIKKKYDLILLKETNPDEWGKYRNHRTYVLDAEKKLLSLNLCGCDLPDADFLEGDAYKHLQALNLSQNNLKTLRVPATLRDLQYLDASENSALHTLTLEGPLPALHTLAADSCALQAFALPEGMQALEKLDLRNNKLAQLTFEAACPRLSYLDASQNKLTNLRLPGTFPALKYVYLNDNQLVQLVFDTPPVLLDTLHLRNNQLQDLPDNLLGFSGLRTLYLHGNPLPAMQDLINSDERGNSWSAVESWLRSFQKSDRVHLHQAKMVLVGNGEVGKTSLQRRLIDPKAPLTTKEERTPGLEVRDFWLKNIEPKETDLDAPIDFLLNIWDFGGQGKYREVQQIFCSRKTLYLFVTAHDDDTTDDDYSTFEYWLSMVNAFGVEPTANHPSPVIHVVTKMDEQPRLVDEAKRKGLFQNINGFIKVSSKTLQNFKELKDLIKSALKDISSDVFKAEYSQYWINVKEELERRKGENYITKTEYLRVCTAHRLDTQEAENWLPTLGRIGTVIHFGEDPVLKDWIILNPVWAKNALYKVLESEIVSNGIIPKQLFKGIWTPDFPEETHEHLIALMRACRLCFEWVNLRGEREYVIPALLPAAAPPLPDYLPHFDFETKCIYDPFVPPGTVNKLMVALQDHSIHELRTLEQDAPTKSMSHTKVEIYKDYIWKNNLIVHDPVNHIYAHVWENWTEKSVHIRLFGKQPEPLFQHLCKTLESLNQELKTMKYMSKLSLTTYGLHKGSWITFDTMKTLDTNFFETKPNHNKVMSKPKVFVSYAHKDDSRYMKLVVEQLKLFSDWEIFDDRSILIGEDWHERLQKEVQVSDFAVLLLTQPFIKSPYIKPHEFEKFIERTEKEQNFKFFSILLSDCKYEEWKSLAKRQFFVAHGEDYDLAKQYRGKQITFDRLVKFDSDGELIPNSYIGTFFMNFVEKVTEALEAKRQ